MIFLKNTGDFEVSTSPSFCRGVFPMHRNQAFDKWIKIRDLGTPSEGTSDSVVMGI